MKTLLIIFGSITSSITLLFIYSSLVIAKQSDEIYEKEIKNITNK